MASYNKIILMGNLTRDPELRYSTEGLAVCNFDIAVNSNFRRGGSSEGREETLFIRIVSFNKQAETVAQYLKKGSSVMVDGRLQVSSWEGEDGVKRSRPEVISQTVNFLPRAGEQGPSGGGAPARSAGREEASVDISSIDDISDDEIPF